MIFSAEQTFSDDQTITVSAASTNVIDLGAPGTVHGAPAPLVRDIGKGREVPLLVQVTQDFVGAESLTAEVQVSAAENFASPTTLVSSTIPGARLKAGVKFPVVWVPIDANLRYVRIFYSVVPEVTGEGEEEETAPVSGKVTAGVVAAVQTNDTVAGAAFA